MEWILLINVNNTEIVTEEKTLRVVLLLIFMGDCFCFYFHVKVCSHGAIAIYLSLVMGRMGFRVITIEPCERLHWIPCNPLYAIKSTLSIVSCEHTLRAGHTLRLRFLSQLMSVVIWCHSRFILIEFCRINRMWRIFFVKNGIRWCFLLCKRQQMLAQCSAGRHKLQRGSLIWSQFMF